MKTYKPHAKYIEWLSAEDMHETSKEWLSLLEFCKDEQLFFDDLIKSYTLQLIDHNYEESKELVAKISKIVKETESLFQKVIQHEHKLKIMVDGKDEIKKEAAYKNEHRELTALMSNFENSYQKLKTQLFDLIKMIIKESKQKRLLQ